MVLVHFELNVFFDVAPLLLLNILWLAICDFQTNGGILPFPMVNIYDK